MSSTSLILAGWFPDGWTFGDELRYEATHFFGGVIFVELYLIVTLTILRLL